MEEMQSTNFQQKTSTEKIRMNQWKSPILMKNKVEKRWISYIVQTNSFLADILPSTSESSTATTDCPYCDYKTTDIEQFKAHIVAHIRDKNYRCLLCNRLYKYRGKINRRIRFFFICVFQVIVHFIFVENIIDIVLIRMITFNVFCLILLMVMNLCRHKPVHMEESHQVMVQQPISSHHENRKNLCDISVVPTVIIHQITVEMFGKNSLSLSIHLVDSFL